MIPIGSIENIYDQNNVQFVNQIFPERLFNDLFPQRFKQFFKYEEFLKAVAQFPYFCDEHKTDTDHVNLQTAELACRRELATFFAHVIYATGYPVHSDINSFRTGLAFRREDPCRYLDSNDPKYCEYHDDYSQISQMFAYNPEEEYYGRGALQIRWSSVYSLFSKTLYPSQYTGETVLRDDPDRVYTDNHLLFVSALWQYMVPQYPKASSHQIVTGFFVPSDVEMQYNMGTNFGTTIDALSNVDEPQAINTVCDLYAEETPQAQLLGEIYTFLLDYFGLQHESDLGCSMMAYSYREDDYPFWTSDSHNSCTVVNFPTLWTVYNADDYKRCVCATWGVGEQDCPQKTRESCAWQYADPQDVVDSGRLEIFGRNDELVHEHTDSTEFKFVVQKIACIESSGKVRDTDFVTVELIQDNEGRTAVDADFRTIYQNTDDSVFGTIAPKGIYIATTMGQNTAYFNEDSEFHLYINGTEHSGDWLFRIRPCVDRMDEEYGGFDCARNEDMLSLTIVNLCSQDPNQYKECQIQEPEEPEDPVEPDPDTDDDEKDKDEQKDEEEDQNETNEDTDDKEDEPDTKPEPEIEPTPVPVPGNNAPVLLDFDQNDVTEVRRNSVAVFDVASRIFDVEEDFVTIRATLPDNMKLWVSFDDAQGFFKIAPTANTKLGMWRGVKLTLSDGKEETSYQLIFWVKPEDMFEDDVDGEIGDEDQTESDTGSQTDEDSSEEEAGVEDSQNGDESEDKSDEESDDESEGVDDEVDGKQDEEEDEGEPDADFEELFEAVSQDDFDDHTIVDVAKVEEFKLAAAFEYKESDFDNTTVWAMNKIQNLVEQRSQKVPPRIAEERQKMPEPEVTIKEVSQIGEVHLVFSQAMQLEDIFSFFQFASDKPANGRRLNQNDAAEDAQVEKGAKVNLDRLVYAYLNRGDLDTSAKNQRLQFDSYLTDYSDQEMFLKLEFESPLDVSIGDAPDKLVLAFRASELFVSQESGKPLKQGASVTTLIPKQFPSQGAFDLAVATGSTVQVAANTAFLSQFGFTICLAVSLKTMWNLMHTLQLVAYLRFVVVWPANAGVMLKSLHNAITLENLVNSIYDSIVLDFNKLVNETNDLSSKENQLKAKEIFYDNWWMSLGIFGIFLVLLLSIMLFYIILNLLALRFTCCEKMRLYLRAKLFYSVWIRYMIEAYLKMTHSCVFYLSIWVATAATSGFDDASFYIRAFVLAVFVVWPFFVTAFLWSCRKHLTEQNFKVKFNSMYSGLKTSQFMPLLYTLAFCLRRLLIVCALLWLQNKGVWLILAFNLLMSIYFLYMVHAVPYEGHVHNKLEYFNELCLISMQYLMIFFVPGGLIEADTQWQTGNVSMGLMAFLFLVNLFTLVQLNTSKIVLWFRRKQTLKKIKKARAQRMKKRAAMLKQQQPESARRLKQTDDALGKTDIVKDFSESEAGQSYCIDNLLRQATKKGSAFILSDDDQSKPRKKIDEDDYFVADEIYEQKGMMRKHVELDEMDIMGNIPLKVNSPSILSVKDQMHKQDSGRHLSARQPSSHQADTAAGYSESYMAEQRPQRSGMSIYSIREPDCTDIRRAESSHADTNYDYRGGEIMSQERKQETKKSNTRQNFAKLLSFAETPRVRTERQLKNSIVPLPNHLDTDEQMTMDKELDREVDYRKQLEDSTFEEVSIARASQQIDEKMIENTVDRHLRKLLFGQENVIETQQNGARFMSKNNKKGKIAPAPMIDESYDNLGALPPSGRRIAKMRTQLSIGGQTPTPFNAGNRFQDTLSYIPDESLIETPALNTVNHSMVSPKAEFERQRAGKNSVVFQARDFPLKQPQMQVFMRSSTNVSPCAQVRNNYNRRAQNRKAGKHPSVRPAYIPEAHDRNIHRVESMNVTSRRFGADFSQAVDEVIGESHDSALVDSYCTTSKPGIKKQTTRIRKRPDDVFSQGN